MDPSRGARRPGAPPGLRFVMATRRGVRLGVHRLRLEGDLTEIGEPDLRFTVAEARELCVAAGLQCCPMEVCSVTCCAGTKPAGFTELAERITGIR